MRGRLISWGCVDPPSLWPQGGWDVTFPSWLCCSANGKIFASLGASASASFPFSGHFSPAKFSFVSQPQERKKRGKNRSSLQITGVWGERIHSWSKKKKGKNHFSCCLDIQKKAASPASKILRRRNQFIPLVPLEVWSFAAARSVLPWSTLGNSRCWDGSWKPHSRGKANPASFWDKNRWMDAHRSWKFCLVWLLGFFLFPLTLLLPSAVPMDGTSHHSQALFQDIFNLKIRKKPTKQKNPSKLKVITQCKLQRIPLRKKWIFHSAMEENSGFYSHWEWKIALTWIHVGLSHIHTPSQISAAGNGSSRKAQQGF